MAGLSVTISDRLADAIFELVSSSVESSAEGMDDELEGDLVRFRQSVTKAKRRKWKRDTLKRARVLAGEE